MAMKRSLYLVFLFAAVVAAVKQAPAVPSWPANYLIEARFEMQPVGFNHIVFENVTIYVDAMNGGLQAYDNSQHYIIQSFALNASFEVLAAYNQFMCIVTPTGGGPSLGLKHVHTRMLAAAPSGISIQPGLPPMDNYTYMGEMLCPGMEKQVCDHFQKVEPASTGSGKISNYELYTLQDGTPYRYEWVGYDEVFGSHFDHYVITYKKYVPNFSNPSLLVPPAELCNTTTEAQAPKQWVEGNSGAHHMHKALHSEAHAGFRKLVREHNKKYNSQEEYNHRMLNFASNSHLINTHNSNAQKTYKLKMNQHGDLTLPEMRRSKGLLGVDLSGAKKVHTADPTATIPTNVDWRQMNYVSPVKDQGYCGSCWSFSSTGALEGQYAKKYGEMVILSQQFLVDCAWNGNYGCDGGMQNQAYQYIQEVGGIPAAVTYGEYKMINEMCHYNNKTPAAQVSGFVAIPQGDETALAQASSMAGPIAISIDASHFSFVFYYSGVYYEPMCQNGPDDLDHAVLLIGYGVEDRQDYWLVKNSWSTFWGDFGYVKMARNRNNNCGVATGALYPIVV